MNDDFCAALCLRLMVGPPGSREAATGMCSQLKIADHARCRIAAYWNYLEVVGLKTLPEPRLDFALATIFALLRRSPAAHAGRDTAWTAAKTTRAFAGTAPIPETTYSGSAWRRSYAVLLSIVAVIAPKPVDDRRHGPARGKQCDDEIAKNSKARIQGHNRAPEGAIQIQLVRQ